MSYVDSLLAPGEEKLYEAHQHILFVIGRILLFVLFAAVLIAAGVLLRVYLPPRIPNPATAALVGNIAVFAALVLALVPLVQALLALLAWRNHQYVVTSRRVISAAGVLNKNTFDSSLNTINDLVTSQSFLGRIFNFGSLTVLTGNDAQAPVFEGIEAPLTFKKAMLVAREQFLRELSGGYRAAPAATPALPPPQYADDPNEITRLIAQLAQLHQQGAISQAEYDSKRAELLRRL